MRLDWRSSAQKHSNTRWTKYVDRSELSGKFFCKYVRTDALGLTTLMLIDVFCHSSEVVSKVRLEKTLVGFTQAGVLTVLNFNSAKMNLC